MTQVFSYKQSLAFPSNFRSCLPPSTQLATLSVVEQTDTDPLYQTWLKQGDVSKWTNRNARGVWFLLSLHKDAYRI